MEGTLNEASHVPVQQVVAGPAATRWTVLTPVGRMSYAKLQQSELANDKFNSERVRRAFYCLLGVSGEQGSRPIKTAG